MNVLPALAFGVSLSRFQGAAKTHEAGLPWGKLGSSGVLVSPAQCVTGAARREETLQKWAIESQRDVRHQTFLVRFSGF